MKNRYILHIINSPNNLMFNLTDFMGNTKFKFTAKSAKYKSKQVRRTIVVQTLWKFLFTKIKNYNFKNLSVKFHGQAFKKKELLKNLSTLGYRIISIDIKLPISFNGCKTRHYRRV